MRRLVVLLLLACVTSGVILFGGMSHASAAICAEPPKPAAPKQGIPGHITATPATPVEGDPFTDPSISIHDVYGTSWSYSTYDLGCLPDPTGGDMVARFDTSNATLVMEFASLNVATLALLERLAKDSEIGWLAEWVGSMSEAIRPIVFGGDTQHGRMVGLLPAAILLTAIWMAWQSSRGNLSKVGHQLAVLGISLLLATWTMVAPALATRAADSAVTTVAESGSSAFNASLTDGVNRQALYKTWLAGHFVDADSQVAVDYGPRLYRATNYSWSEWATVQADPEQGEEITKAKGDDFVKMAEELKENHPAIYDKFRGVDAQRSGSAVYAIGVSFVMSFFAVIALFIVLIARLMMLGLVVVAPIGAILGVLPNGERTLWQMWSLFFASLINVFKFTLSAGLITVLMGRLMTLDPASAALWMIVATVVFFIVLKPFKSFKTMTPGLDPNRSYSRELGGLVAKLGVAAATGGVSGAAAGAQVSKSVTETDTETTKVDLRAPDPLPGPVFRQVPDSNRKAALPGPAAGSPAPHRPQIGSGPSGWEGVAATRPLPPAPPQRVQVDVNVRPQGVDQSRVIIDGEVVHGHYVPRSRSKVEAQPAGAGRSEVELYVPRKRTPAQP